MSSCVIPVHDHFAAMDVYEAEEGLVGCWTFDEGSGDTAYDSSGNGNNGTIHGAAWTTGVNGSALKFDGTDDYVEILNTDILESQNSLTISAWVKVQSSTSLKYFVKTDGFGLFQSGSEMGVAISVPGTDNAAGIITFNQWEFITGSFDGTAIRFYKNGELIEITALSGTMSSGSQYLVFGFFNNNYWGGEIDEVRIYNRILNSEEILSHYEEYAADLPQRKTLDTIFTVDSDSYYTWMFSWEKNEEYQISIQTTIGGPVDIFLVDSEGYYNYSSPHSDKWWVPLLRSLNTSSFSYYYTGPETQDYYIVIENKNYTLGGASSTGPVTLSIVVISPERTTSSTRTSSMTKTTTELYSPPKPPSVNELLLVIIIIGYFLLLFIGFPIVISRYKSKQTFRPPARLTVTAREPPESRYIREFDERHQITEDVSSKLQQYLSKMKTKRRLEIAILVSGLSFIGVLWIWILAIWWMAYRRVEDDFVSLWSNFPGFNPVKQFRTVFNEETHSILTHFSFLDNLRRNNDIKRTFIVGLTVPMFGWFFIFMLPIFFASFFSVVPIFFATAWVVDFETLSLIFGWAYLIGFIACTLTYGVIVFLYGIRSPFKKELKKETKMRSKLDPSSESFVAQDESEFELTAPTDEHMTSFHVKKSGRLAVTYKIDNNDNFKNMVAFRSSLNRLAIYAMIVIPFILLFGTSNSPGLLFIISSFSLLLLLVILVPNKWILVRRITILDEHGTPIGYIKGNLYFTWWEVSDLRGEYKASLNFNFIRHRGEIKTQDTSLYLLGDQGRTDVYDNLNNQVFSVISPDSIYVRKRFSIESNDQINPFLIVTLSVCIIERFYKPKSQSSN
ncbi:MAG: LamG domain-containing protein [Candidatus Hodarchaeales archaeon]|jgi:hypothetical protein